MKRLKSQLNQVEVYGVIYQESTNSFVYANNKDGVYHYKLSTDEIARRDALGIPTKVCAFLKKSYVSSLFDDEWYRSFINEKLVFPIHEMSSNPSLCMDDFYFRKGLVYASNRTLERLHHLKQKMKECKAEKKRGGSEPVRRKTEAPGLTLTTDGQNGTARKKTSTTESVERCALENDYKPSSVVDRKGANPKLKKGDASAEVTSKSEVVERSLGRKKAVPKSVRDEVWRRFGGGTCTTSVCQVCEISTISYLCGSGSKAVLGHVQSRSLGGTGEVDNLRPICANCNSTMGTQNMFAFKASRFPMSSPASWMQLHGALIH